MYKEDKKGSFARGEFFKFVSAKLPFFGK